MNGVISVFCIFSSLLIHAQSNDESFGSYMGKLMTDDIWTKFLKDIKKQHEFCRLSSVEIKLQSYFGGDRFEYEELEQPLLKRQEVLVRKPYISIGNKYSNKVVVAAKSGLFPGDSSDYPTIQMWEFLNENNQTTRVNSQFWFWDGQALRSKLYPGSVMTFDTQEWKETGFGKVFLSTYTGSDAQKWTYEDRNYIKPVIGKGQLTLDIKGSDPKDGAVVGCYLYQGTNNQKFGMYSKLFLQNATYIPGKFSSYMATNFDNDLWYKLLVDLDQLEAECRLGYIGSYHVDLPWIMGLDFAETSNFYLKKAQLYQGYKVAKGPFSTFMSELLDGRAWLQIILTLTHMTSECTKVVGDDAIPKKGPAEYLSANASADTFRTLLATATAVLYDEKNFPSDITKRKMSKEAFAKLGQFMNDYMDDKGWIQLVQDVSSLELYCVNVLQDFKHFNWAFHAGVTSEPLKAYELYSYISAFTNELPKI